MSKRGGFRREKPLYKLRFEDGQLDGFEVMAKSLPLGEFFELQRLQTEAPASTDAAEQIVRKLAGVIVSWNLENDDDGEPVPATYEGLAAQDLPFVLSILHAWTEAVAGVPKASLNGSSAGGTSLERSIPMEAP